MVSSEVDMPLISTNTGLRLGANWIACASPEVQEQFLSELEPEEMAALPYLFEFWAMEHQLPPEGSWRNWVVLGGRGAGKTRAGAEWVRSVVEGPLPSDPGACKHIALVGETVDQVREVMIFGESGIMACSPDDRRPVWEATRKRLVWANGAIARVHTAHDPEGLRGPQYDAAWVDELAKWPKATETWEQLQFTLRLGDDPRVCVTTTPRNVSVLKKLLDAPSTVQTHAPTTANAANLAASFLEEIKARFEGTRTGRQELEGILLSDVDGALWTSVALEEARVDKLPVFDRVVVGLDPVASVGTKADECGIIVVGLVSQGPVQDWRAYVIADATVQGATPAGWAAAAITAMEVHGGDKLVVEVNQGGAMVSEVLRQVDPMVPIKAVHASKGKSARAEPVAALYEQGRVYHARGLGTLEEQMCLLTPTGFEGQGSPDRVDALVWALHELMIEPAAKWRRPQMRRV
ncbi:MAG: terminase family protein [Pseudomonadota bacterium]